MQNENENQNIQLAEIKKDVKYILEKMDGMIESYNGKNRMLDDRITKEVGENKKLLDLHCPRIRQLETFMTEIKPIKRLYDKVGTFAIGVIILLGSTVVGVAVYLKDHLK